ncbi:MAG: biopolymer transporter ExbD [Denitromonas halophila]|jgi:biopolymer transport protein ExbD|uniref:Biopolymer transporter ExbD n=1 Tax=Denitromonas halophila TaxID=1629404 RepID=A0A558EXU8_9RHOO|nr:biopolymer transporter ExbD [Denitromonas halophila]TVO58121.1 biopolymer transporter ExbD [Denitromonas halophila]TVT49165.1 MAG: biopolymer transporter ExbD [Denitromonas halophila]TVT72006.1 MAG: biopolymer transporter ExbD [Denitromonas halophila]TVT78170.1 MAG: biopolymer transporter ExbD [Denitromonas halophila]
MRFQTNRRQEEPEINLIPLIDVLLVIIIFLMLTTTYAKFSGLELNLPTASADAIQTQANEINIAVTADGDVLINRVPVIGRDIDAIAAALGRAAPADAEPPLVVINADAKAQHQRVVDVMQAAQRVGLPQITFATRGE